jgi:hypothetical protein
VEDDDVYGSWQKYDDGSWGAADRPEGQAGTTQARDRANAGSQPATRDRSTTGAGSAGGWDSATRDQLDRDSRARSEGTQRTRDYSSYQGSGGSRSSASTYRPSGGSRGGGGRGGGGRRR